MQILSGLTKDTGGGIESQTKEKAVEIYPPKMYTLFSMKHIFAIAAMAVAVLMAVV